nr:actin protein 7B [Hymenolepis microstoma]
MIIVYLQHSQYSEVKYSRRPHDGTKAHTQEATDYMIRNVPNSDINRRRPKSPKKASNSYSPRSPPVSSSMMDLNERISSSPRQPSYIHSPHNSAFQTMTLEQNIKLPRSPRQPSNAHSTGNILEISPTKEVNVRTPRTPRWASNDYSPRSSAVTTPNIIVANQAPRPASRQCLPKEDEYVRRYSVTKSKCRSRSQAPNENIAQRKSLNMYDNAKDIQPIPTKRNSSANMDTSASTILTPRYVSTPTQLSNSGTIEKVHSVDTSHAAHLSRDDSFFDKVLAFEKNKENSLQNGSGGQIKHTEAIKMSPAKSQEPIVRGQGPNPQNSVQYPIIVPSKKSLPPNSFSPKPSVNADQKLISRKLKSPDSFAVYNNNDSQNGNSNRISPLYEGAQKRLSPVQRNPIASPIVKLELQEMQNGHYQSNSGSTPLDASPQIASPQIASPHIASPQIASPRPQTAPRFPQKIVVIDMGHYYIRIGILRDQPTEPDYCIPNSVALTSKGLLFGDAVPRIADPGVGQELGTTSVISPLRQSQITKPILVNGIPIQKVLFQNVIKRLNLTEKDYKLLLCLPTRASALRPYFLDYFIGPSSKTDQQGVDCFEAVATISAFRAALQTAKISTCLIISLNADLEIIPIAEGTLLEHGRSTTALYGEMALKYFLEELVNGGVNLTEKEIDCFGPYIYQKAAFIENQDSKCGSVVIDLAQYTPYPLDKRICVPSELRRKASDGLLRSENSIEHDGELPPFTQLLKAAIQSCDLDLRSSICSNVLIIGEFAEIEGFRERVQEEICAIIPGSRPNVQVAPTPAECVFEGACLLTALLQGPYAPKCPWFRFIDDLAWSNICHDANATNGITDTRLLSRLNRDCVWP